MRKEALDYELALLRSAWPVIAKASMTLLKFMQDYWVLEEDSFEDAVRVHLVGVLMTESMLNVIYLQVFYLYFYFFHFTPYIITNNVD